MFWMLAPFLGQAMGMTAGATAALGAGIGAATNKDNPLMGAVSGGLGAFGGANMLGAAKDFGTGAAADVMAGGATNGAAPNIGQSLLGPQTTPSLVNPLGSGMSAPIPGMTPPAAPGASLFGGAGVNTPSWGALGATPVPAAPSGFNISTPLMNATPQVSLSDGMSAVMKDPGGYFKSLDSMKTIYPLAGSAMLGGFNKPVKEVEEEGSNVKAKDIKYTHYGENATPTSNGPHWSSEMSYFSPVARARGGPIDPHAEHGDGMDDATPALIDGKQPAALGSGEYVMDATTVAHLGNGSSAAGFKKLDKMRERVNKARTGGLAQARKINPEKYMPA